MTRDFDLTTRDGQGETRLIGVGDVVHTQLPGSSAFVRADRAEDSFLLEGFGIAAAGAGPDGLVALVEQTDDVTVTDSVGGVRTFRGTVAVEDLAGLDELPPGASFLADPARLRDYPDAVTVTIDVSGGLLSRLELRMFGDTTAGRTDITVTTTFSDLETDQDMPRPCPDRRRLPGGQPRSPLPGARRVHVHRQADLPPVLDDNGEAEVAQAVRTYVQALPPGLR